MRNSLKTTLLMLLLLTFCGSTAFAIPAYPKARKVVQPDGTTILLQGHGDEFFHYLTTEDGTVVAKDADGFYRPTGEDSRKMAPAHKVQNTLKRLEPRRIAVAGRPYRGLVLLVNFSDRQFSRGGTVARNFYDKMMNGDKFTSDLDKYYGSQKYTGSVKEYFKDNSYGKFVPEFDVVGPIDIQASQYDLHGVANTYKILEEVLRTADSKVDYSKYDSDGDGIMDMVYIIYAGYSSHYEGNDERLLWPHASDMTHREDGGKSFQLDGTTMGRFACSAEIFGWQEDGDLLLDGIGVIVHEFSHVLGFQDHYDSSNGYQEHPNAWDVMAAGCYSDDFNRTPCGFNSYEKYAAGFISPQNITEMAGQSITLRSTMNYEDACILRNYQKTVCFLMENRQALKWDKNLPGHGLCVWRVDSTNVDYWTANALNVTTRACFRLVRACGTQGSFMTGVEDTDYDAFPGTHKVTELDNDEDLANLISYDGYPCPVVLREISENGGIINFKVEEDPDARPLPITYSLPKTFYATAEVQVDDNQWKTISWAITTKTIGETRVINNFLPHSENFDLSYTYTTDTHAMTINAQRMSLNADYGTWICDFKSVDEQGAGAMQLHIGRYGIPTFDDPSTYVGFCTMKPKAYMISQKNMIDRTAVYRNIVFTDEQPTDIQDIIETPQTSPTRKYLENGNIYIIKRGKKFNVSGNEVR